MESALLGLVLDSSVVIGAERNKQPIPEFIEAILRKHGPINLSLFQDKSKTVMIQFSNLSKEKEITQIDFQAWQG